jgi:pimeloyl-ACP methyl ester carboxylesterase
MARLLLFPGIGANHLLFTKTLKAFPEAEFPAWQKPLPKESLADYAKRWAPSFSSKPTVLVGMSFGGMVALELAKWLGPKSVVLLSSCWETRAILPRFRALERVSRWVPDSLVRGGIRTLGAPITARRQKVDSADKGLLVQMSQELDLPFARWACYSASTWRFSLSTEGKPAYPLFALHGRQDPVIPLVEAAWVEVVEDGRHLLPLTHPDRVNAIIQKALR